MDSGYWILFKNVKIHISEEFACWRGAQVVVGSCKRSGWSLEKLKNYNKLFIHNMQRVKTKLTESYRFADTLTICRLNCDNSVVSKTCRKSSFVAMNEMIILCGPLQVWLSSNNVAFVHHESLKWSGCIVVNIFYLIRWRVWKAPYRNVWHSWWSTMIHKIK